MLATPKQRTRSMPNIIVKVPEGVFDTEACQALARGMTSAAKTVECIGDDPRQEFLTWVAIDEVKAGYMFAGGKDPLPRVIPVIVLFYLPEGVIDDAGRAEAVKLIQDAAADAKSAADPRPVLTSVIVADVADGTWGASGQLWRLPDFARAAGYKHLQRLVKPSRRERGLTAAPQG